MVYQDRNSDFRKLVEETTRGGGLNADVVAQVLAEANVGGAGGGSAAGTPRAGRGKGSKHGSSANLLA